MSPTLSSSMDNLRVGCLDQDRSIQVPKTPG